MNLSELLNWRGSTWGCSGDRTARRRGQRGAAVHTSPKQTKHFCSIAVRLRGLSPTTHRDPSYRGGFPLKPPSAIFSRLKAGCASVSSRNPEKPRAPRKEKQRAACQHRGESVCTRFTNQVFVVVALLNFLDARRHTALNTHLHTPTLASLHMLLELEGIQTCLITIPAPVDSNQIKWTYKFMYLTRWCKEDANSL